MAGRKDLEAGRATIVLSLKNNIQNGLRLVEKQLKAFEAVGNKLGESLTRIGTHMVAPLLAAGLASEKVRSKLDEARKSLTEALEPVLLPMVDALAKIVKQVSAWIAQNPKLVSQWLKIGLALIAVGAAFKVAAAAAAVLAIAAGTLATLLGALPASLIALGAMVALWATFTESGRRSIQAVLRWFGEIGRTFMAVVNLIAGGSMEAAWELVLSKMTLSWTKFQDRVRQGWLDLLPEGAPGGFLEAFRETLKGTMKENEAEVKRLEARLAELMKMAGVAVPTIGAGAVGGDAKGPLSTFSAAGAALLGNGISSIPQRTLEEIRLMRRSMAEAVRFLREMAARRERPGIFRP